jgi:hypothetical protein
MAERELTPYTVHTAYTAIVAVEPTSTEVLTIEPVHAFGALG